MPKFTVNAKVLNVPQLLASQSLTYIRIYGPHFLVYLNSDSGSIPVSISTTAVFPQWGGVNLLGATYEKAQSEFLTEKK